MTSAAIAALALLAGCPAAHSDYPNLSCKAQSDCYQGETCQLHGDNGTCVPNSEIDLSHPVSNNDGGI